MLYGLKASQVDLRSERECKALVSGLLANYLVTDLSLGPVAPFDAAAVFLAVGGVVIFFTWTENKVRRCSVRYPSV